MIHRIRTVAILMLLAGLALGVLTARTVRAFGTSDLLSTPVTSGSGPRIERLVQVYKEEFHLSDLRADKIRWVLESYDRKVASEMWSIRQENAAKFRAIFDEASEEIREILKEE